MTRRLARLVRLALAAAITTAAAASPALAQSLAGTSAWHESNATSIGPLASRPMSPGWARLTSPS